MTFKYLNHRDTHIKAAHTPKGEYSIRTRGEKKAAREAARLALEATGGQKRAREEGADDNDLNKRLRTGPQTPQSK